MAATTFSNPLDVTSETDLSTAAALLSSYVADYGFYNSSDYPTWKSALSSGVTAGNGLESIQFGDKVFFIEYDPAVGSITAVQYHHKVILIQTAV